MNNREIAELTGLCIANTYRRFPVAFVRGKGTRLWDADGKEYLDFVSGLAVCNLGHCHPKVVEAIRNQAATLIHTSNLYHIGPQAELAKLLCGNSFADKVFFCNSGAEANEAAIKLVRKYFSLRGEGRFKIISMEKSFHGRTMATMSATGQKKFQAGFEPLLEKFVYVPFNDIGAVGNAVNSDTAAVIVEPIQGEGGVNVPSDNYLKELKSLCRESGILLIFDEVQVGMGRTGTLFAYENYGVSPDVMTLAKGLGGGIAIGAMLATDEVAGAFTPGSHASTFGGNHLATAAGVAAVEATLNEGVLDNCKKAGAELIERLSGLKKDFPFIKEIRGKGLIVGMELTIPVYDIVNKCLERRLLVNCAGETVLRFIPALIVTGKEVDEMVGILRGVLKGV
ncbi:MAG: aspartate aminotransferase family protein [Deltaproteobacteria bacterium]|nr:aspartate aminotransferase family protein [Deltaproteobacteria bacterium]